MKRIMICGAGGQLGQKLIGAARALPVPPRIFAYNRSDFDITNPKELQLTFAEAQPDVVFNAAAYTAVDRAESEPAKARQVNVEAAGSLASACAAAGIKFVHFSTDYVYAGDYNRPLLETDRTLGTSVYAKTKLEGEAIVQQNHPAAYILRTSWVYAEYGENFLRTMLRLGRERESLGIVADQVGSPTYAADLAAAAMQLVLNEAPSGIYNFSNSGAASWYDFAHAIFELSGLGCQLHPIRTEQYPTPAKRPAYSVLDTRKIAEWTGQPRHWREALKDCLGKLQRTGKD
ncbi:dTDP-4-dehydrorhamnose reductase [Neolewinella lacunae]|uniref:dTDP-4-dehydrorhamnose reductase n=1 Tax=Neolewinella lacunae TaxID=1517758 RepID=A0A923PL54_9BACT|nr:dTDP-4-dehydrorhamnose reductase [Neolewinella lacunae]MBC6994550.1 dTDP-4-dehydrorhamnose reductase [Neolewinella lacunae]MDN3634243.1 dTDP-4-dehydrorhamnose reductase [Neolewinella lacunae]